MTADLHRWYSRFGWIDRHGLPVKKVVDNPILTWLESHPEITWIRGGYWDVYRLVFRTGGRLRGQPYPIYPNRFPEWVPESSRQVLIARRDREGDHFSSQEATARDGGSSMREEIM